MGSQQDLGLGPERGGAWPAELGTGGGQGGWAGEGVMGRVGEGLGQAHSRTFQEGMTPPLLSSPTWTVLPV